MPFSCTQMARPWQKINQFKKVKWVLKNIAYEWCSSKVVSNRIFATRLTFTLGSRNKKRGLTFSLYCFTRIMIKPYSVDPLFACCASSVCSFLLHMKRNPCCLGLLGENWLIPSLCSYPHSSLFITWSK